MVDPPKDLQRLLHEVRKTWDPPGVDRKVLSEAVGFVGDQEAGERRFEEVPRRWETSFSEDRLG